MPVAGSVRLGGSDVKRPDCGVTSRARMRENRRAIERDQIVAARDVADFDNFARPEVADSRKAESGTPNAPVGPIRDSNFSQADQTESIEGPN